MIRYELYNANFKNKKTSDCVIRALANASGYEYKVVATQLFGIYMSTGYMMNDKHCYEKWLDANGFVKMKQPRRKNGKKYLVGEIDELINSDDCVVISCAHHLTSVTDDTLEDIWDCRYMTIGNYYVKRRTN